MIVNAQSTVDVGETVGRQLQTVGVVENSTALLQREKPLFLQSFICANRFQNFLWNDSRLASRLFPSHDAVLDPVVAGQLDSGLQDAKFLGDAVDAAPKQTREKG